MKSTFLLAGVVLVLSNMAARALPATLEVAAQNLAKVPATDPSVADAPHLLDAVKGVYPRLLFKTQEIAGFTRGSREHPVAD